jgi:hypothetical protein
VRDQAWVDTVGKQNLAETARLEAELKGYKNNLIKESIRVRYPCPLLDVLMADRGYADGQRGFG